MEFIESIHGKKPLLVFEGFLYREHSRTATGSIRYICINEKTCNAMAIVEADDIKLGKLQCHFPEPAKIEAKKVLNKIKERAITTMERPR